MLEKKTRILCTHAIDFLHLADHVVLLEEGRIEVQGTYEEVIKNKMVQKIVDTHSKNESSKKEAFTAVREEGLIAIPQ
jgi:ABC-type cobalamin/Fe3+-siderophores transport system ATPase subunit